MRRTTLVHFYMSVGTSVLVHGTAFLVVAGLWKNLHVRVSPPPRGIHSIELIASLPAAASSAEELLVRVEPMVMRMSQESDPPQERRLRIAASEMLLSKQGPLPAPAAPQSLAQTNLDSVRLIEVTRERAPAVSQAEPQVINEQPDHRVQRAASAASIASKRDSGVQTDSLPTKILAQSPPPAYPPDALAERLTGSVDLRVRVGRDGQVIQASIYRSSGVRSFDESALAAVHNWRFLPATVGGVAIAKDVLVGVDFVLD